jgi:hypothetical protein
MSDQYRTMPKRMGTTTRQRKVVFNHVRHGHDLGYKEFGTEYRRLYVDREADTIEVGKSDEFDTIEAGIFCFTCDRWVGTWQIVDEFL